MISRPSIALTAVLALVTPVAVWAAVVEKEAVTLTTSDGVSIHASLFQSSAQQDKVPAVVFVHQGGSQKEEWLETSLLQDVIAAGWVALLIDLRGHGESGGGPVDFSVFFDDPQQAPNDLIASIDYLQGLDVVDSRRIAIVGASVGANLAIMASGDTRFEIAAAIAISAKTSAAYNLAGGEARLSNLKGVYYVSSADDQDGQRAAWARQLFARTAEPTDLAIVQASSAHGVSVFQDDPGLEKRLFDWLSQRFAVSAVN